MKALANGFGLVCVPMVKIASPEIDPGLKYALRTLEVQSDSGRGRRMMNLMATVLLLLLLLPLGFLQMHPMTRKEAAEIWLKF